MLLVSIPIMAFALLVCAAAFSTMDLTPSSSSSPAPDGKPANLRAPLVVLLAITIYTASYACGIGTIPWQQSELFPLSVRALGSALATATNWSSNFIVGLTFLPLMELISPGWTFVVYAAVCGLGLGAIWFVYPEMSGLGLEDVRGLLADGWGVPESLAQFKMRGEAGI
jgi:SP family myo-inositol transporter-like MFS transporter 13